MKKFISFALLVGVFASSASALDVTELTGSFEDIPKVETREEIQADLAFGSFILEDKGRLPAKEVFESKDKVQSITEVTGTFETP